MHQVTSNDLMALAFFSLLIGYLMGLWIGHGLRAFVMRRNEQLEREIAELRNERDPADWWKGSPPQTP